MNLKFVAIISTLVMFATPSISLAIEGTSVTTTPSPAMDRAKKAQDAAAKIEAKASAKAEKVKAKLGERAAKEIDRRIAALNKLIARLAKMKRLSAETQASLKAKVETEIAKLTALKAKIATETDAATIKTDTESIKSSYRIFALFMPQINLLAASDSMLGAAEVLTKLATKLQTRLDGETSNPDLSTMKTSLAEMNNMINAAKTQATTIQTSIIGLTPEGTDNQTTLKAAHEMLKTGHESLKSARQAAASIIKTLKSTKKATPSASTSASPSAAISPAL